MPSRSDIARYRANIQDEVDSAAIYRSMASTERDPHLATVYLRLAEVEERHAAAWETELAKAGIPVRPTKPSLRSRILIRLGRSFGTRFLVPVVATVERLNRRVYDNQQGATKTMGSEERSHARVLQLITGEGGAGGATVARLEGRHRDVGGNTLRAAVLGANDGLVSNLSLVMGVAGASMSPHAVLLTGLAGLLAGASSMAMGEWIAVQSSRELHEKQVGIEQSEIAAAPEEEAEELALIYMAKGLPDAQAHEIASRIMENGKTALETMAREELGIDPDDLGGSPWTAAGGSFLLFSAGAIVPVLPFAFVHGSAAVLTSVALSAAALVAIGAAITLFTGRSVVATGLRQLLFGLCAAGLTFVVGRIVGASLAP
jgi:VIT1/CCC1 family predicted Fe2+/Mn2+ transporter